MEPDRNWMYERNNPNRVGMREEFADGVTQFINHCKTLDDYLEFQMILCPCAKCDCTGYETIEVVIDHLYRRGFCPNYRVWTSHGEFERNDKFNNFVGGESSRSNVQDYWMTDVQDAFGLHLNFEFGVNVDEVLNEEAHRFYEQLRDAKQRVSANLKERARARPNGLFFDARKKHKKPKFVGAPIWQQMLHYWLTDPNFKRRSEQGKMARASVKGGSLPTAGAISQINVHDKMKKELSKSITQKELFKATHIKKKKKPTDEDSWVEPRAQETIKNI